MKRLKLFFACLLMAVLSIGQMWAADATMSGGTSVTVGGKSAVKVGASKSGGSMTITVGANATSLSFYIAAWSGDNTSVSVTPTANVGTTALSPTQDSGISGSGSSFTLNGTESTYYTTIELSNITAETAITLASSAGKNRFVVWGATYETGGGSTPATVSVESVSLNKDATSLEVGANETLTATVSPNDATNKNVTWESSNNNVATVSSTGVVTAVAEGNATITCKSAADNTKTATCAVTVTPAEVPTLTFDFSAQGYTNQQQYTSINADAKITISFGDGSNDGKYYDTGTAIRVYGGGHMTVAGGEGVTISKILLEFGSGDGSNEISTADNAYANGKWTGSAQSVTFNVGGTSGHRRIKVVKVFYVAAAIDVAMPTISGVTPFLSSTEVTLTQNDADAIYYTTNGDDPTTGSTPYSAPFDLTATATVKAIAVKGGVSSAIASATFTKATVLTVAEAIAAIPNKNDVVNNQYVEGIVCTAGTSVNASGQMTYYISADGTEATRLQIYLGKNLNNTAFTAVSDLAIGDRVVVFGQLKNYNNTPEMNSGNYLVSTETPAVAAPVFSPNGGGFMGETDVTITCATASSTIYYTLDGTTPSKSSSLYGDPIHLNATTTIKAIAYVEDDASLVIAKTFTLTAPMTVAEALAALDSENPINNVAVAGIISTAPSSNPSSGKLTYFISDDGSASDELEVYKGFGVAGASFSDKADLQVGDEVTVFGNLTIYNTTKEFAEGSRLIAFNRPQVDVESISLTESTAEVEEGKTVTLHASVVPANATNKTIVWSVQSGNDKAEVDANGVVTGIAAGEAVIRAASAADATKFAECTVTVTEPAPLSPWASVYTSNVEMAHTGSGVDNGTITIGTDDPYLLVKAGASSSTGTIVVTVPKGTTDLHFHAFAWGGKTAKIELAGVENASVSEFDLAGEAGASGSGNDFTLQGDPVDQYFHVSFDAVAAETEITFSKATGSADNRFFFYGVNQEGGLVLESIAISGTATELEYNDGDHFDPAGLKVMGHYSDNSDAEITEGIVWAFDPDPLTQGTTSVSVTATAGGFTSDPFVVNGLTVSGAAPLSPWASVYTSNVEIASNTAAHVTINGEDYDAAKTSKGASATITLPQGVTAIHLHLVAWSGEAQTVSVTGDCFNEAKELTIEANSNVSGSGTTYNLGTSGTDYYFSLTPDNAVAANTEITIAAEGQKRFVLFGVNQEGGVVPVLKSISIIGTATELEYENGDEFNPVGLGVNAIYTINDVDQEPVAVAAKDIEWSYDPATLTTGTTSVTVTATVGDKSTNLVVNGLNVVDATPEISTDVNSRSWTVTKGDAIPAAKTFAVTLKHVDEATVALGGANPDAFTISPATLTANGNITVSVKSTATVGTYTASITISDKAGVAAEKVVNVTLTVNPSETPVATDSKWIVATSVEDGQEVLLTGVKSDVTYALSAQANNNRTASAGTLDEGVFTPSDNTMAVTLVQQSEGKFALRTSNGKYLYAASSSANNLKTRDAIGDDGKAVWTISINGDNEASIVANCEDENWRNTMQFNQNGNNAPVFNCYASANQSAIKLYVPKPVVTYVAKIGETMYESLPAAVAAAQDGQTVELLMDVAAGPGVMITTAEHKQIIIDFGNHTYCANSPAVGSAGTQNQAFHFEKGCNITLQNGTITSSGNEIIMLIQNYGDLTLLNITLIGNNLPGEHRYVLSNNCGNVVIGAGTTITAKEGDVAFDVCVTNYYPEGTNVTVKPGATITGIVEYDVWGTIPADNKATLTIEGGNFDITWNVEPALAEDAKDNINVGGGIFNAEVPADYCAPGYIPEDNGIGQYGVHYVGYYERGSLTPGNYATICLPNGGKISGASLFDIEYCENSTLYLLEVEGNTMVAGRPYIFLPSVEKIKVIYTDAENATAGTYNGLVGSLSLVAEVIPANDGNYILYNNQYYFVNGEAYVGANRAYIHMKDVPTEPSTPQVGQAPRRRVAMTVNGKQTPTGFESINTSEKPMKLMIDGQIFILRGEKMYNVNGQLVK